MRTLTVLPSLLLAAAVQIPSAGLLAPSGPAAPSVLPAQAPTPWEAFGQGGPSRLALYLTDPGSRWLPLAHALKAFGIPFRITRDASEALKHRVVLVYPLLAPADQAPFRAFVEGGGTLVCAGSFSPSLRPFFGVSGPSDRKRLGLDFREPGIRMGDFEDPRERHVRLGLPDGPAQGGTGWASVSSKASVLASYDDGSAAVVGMPRGQGMAYAIGLDFPNLLYRGQSGRDEWFARAYVNAFEPAGDVFLRLLAAIYRAGEPGAITLGTVPEGKALAFLVTHDIDYARSLENASVYAEYERSLGIRATYFLQTKYVKDDLDTDFLNPSTLGRVRALAALGHEVASHSVSHSARFAQFPMGDGAETYPAYHPFVQNREETRGGTILGELRVSRHLIESILPGTRVASFRPGYLANPFGLPQALQAAGYRYASSLTAAGSLTHLPFRQNYGRMASQELDVWEFPLTVSDERIDDLEARLPAARDVARQVARYGGTFVLLIHPSNVEDKLRFEKAFLPEWKGRAWFGTVGGFGAWWEARDRAGVDVEGTGGEPRVRLDLPLPVHGLVLRIPEGWELREAPGALRLGPGLVSVDAGAGTLVLAFRREARP